MRGLASPHPFLGATWGVVRARLSWLVLVCVLPYVTLLAHCALVCGYVCGHGLRLPLRGSGARVPCRARRCTGTSIWARISCSPWFWCSGVCALRCRLVVKVVLPMLLLTLRGTALCRRREYTFNYFQLQDVVGHVAMSCGGESFSPYGPDNYNYSRFQLKVFVAVRSGRCICMVSLPLCWTVIVWKSCPGVCLRLGSSPNLATDHTLSMCCACLLSVA